MNIEQIFTTYWSQTTLLILGLGYIIKNIIDLSSKKNEINHNLFQQKKLEAANAFFSNCATTERMWKDIPIYDILEYKMTSKQLDAYIFPHINEIRRNIFELQIYFIQKEHEDFRLVLENMERISSKLAEQYYNYDTDVSLIVKANSFQYALDNILVENAALYEKIAKCIRKTFR